MVSDLNQDDSIYLQFMIWMAMAAFPFNLDFLHEGSPQYESIKGSSTCLSCIDMFFLPL
jgi:hypothetical protein